MTVTRILNNKLMKAAFSLTFLALAIANARQGHTYDAVLLAFIAGVIMPTFAKDQ
jgi:hypothetical protein